MVLIPYKQFLTFPKEQKIKWLQEALKDYPAKDIRDHWQMAPQNWYGLVSRYKLSNNASKGQKKTDVEDFIEAEFYTVEDKKPDTQLALAPKMTEAVNEALMNFPEINGNVGQLKKLVESMLMILEATNGKDTAFKLKIAVYKA